MDWAARYSRQILLREVGGLGQKKLFAAPVQVCGWSDALEIAVTYLAAGGSPIVGARPGSTFLKDHQLPDSSAAPIAAVSTPDHPSPLPLEVVVGDELLLRTPTTCARCWASTRARVGAAPESPVIAGALGALLLQRQLLGLSDEIRRFVWRDGQFHPAELARCPEHSKSVFPVQE